jgi:hypothetical protein
MLSLDHAHVMAEFGSAIVKESLSGEHRREQEDQEPATSTPTTYSCRANAGNSSRRAGGTELGRAVSTGAVAIMKSGTLNRRLLF